MPLKAITSPTAHTPAATALPPDAAVAPTSTEPTPVLEVATPGGLGGDDASTRESRRQTPAHRSVQNGRRRLRLRLLLTLSAALLLGALVLLTSRMVLVGALDAAARLRDALAEQHP